MVHIFVCKGKNSKSMLRIVGTTIQNLVVQVTRHLGFLHPWLKHILIISSVFRLFLKIGFLFSFQDKVLGHEDDCDFCQLS